MRILCVYIGDKKGNDLLYLTELSHVGFWTRSIYSDALKFGTSLLCERTLQGHRQVLENKEEATKILVQSFLEYGLGIVTDLEYPLMVGWCFLYKLHQIINDDFINLKTLSDTTIKKITELFKQGQDPKEIDPLLKVEHTLEQVKVVMHQNITEVLKRGEQIEDLIDKSTKLEESSKIFLKRAKDQNRCCKAW